MNTLTDKEIENDNIIIANFDGYVLSPYNVQLHSDRYGFEGTSGYSNTFIKKDQYNMLLDAYDSNDVNTINNFYKGLVDEYSYKFDGNVNHLFLTAYKNRSTKLDWMTKKIKYHEDFNLLMNIVSKIEDKLKFYFSGYKLESEKYITDFEILLNSIEDAFTIKNHKLYVSTDVELVWKAVVEFIKWYELNK